MKKVDSPQLKRMALASAVGLAVIQMAGQAHAQAGNDPSQPAPQAVVVTGSLIRHASDEGATPIVSVKAAELEARGNTELKDLVLEQPQSLSLGTNSGAAGPITNLRGLGPMRTLTLLNGRRLANEPLQDQYVSVNVIPRIALDRVDTLNGGAASTYGADAIGGVQNYWTKRTFNGIDVKGEYATPQMNGGGQTKSLGVIAGWGNLSQDGWNAYLAVDYQEKSALFQRDRPNLFATDVVQNLGIGLAPDARNPSPLANFGFTRSANSNYNPYFASGCLEPYSHATLGNNSLATPPVYSPGCARDNAYWTAASDGSKISTIYSHATLDVGGGHKINVDLLHSDFTVQKYRGMQVPGANQPFTTYSLSSASPFYPGKGITPLPQVIGSNTGANTPAMYIDPTKTPGTVGNLNMANRTIYFQWGPAELGPAYRNDQQKNDRIVVEAEGTVAGWDYRTGLNYGQSDRITKAGEGYVLYSKIQAGFDQGILNPFALQTAAGLDYLKSAAVHDYAYRRNQAYNESVDATFSRAIWQLGGGDLMLALSGELRRDGAHPFGAPLDYVLRTPTGGLAIDASGTVTQTDLVGEAPVGVNKKLHRDISSLMMEVEAPITKTFLVNFAARADHYKDLATTTVNPKVAARWAPVDQLMFRASYQTGFRAPSIMDIQNPTPEVRTQTMDDPVLCPSKQPTVPATGTPASGYTADQVCNVVVNYWTKSPNNSFLKPEKSRGFNFGMGWEPVKNLSLTLDYWGIGMRDVLAAVGIAEVQQNPTKYADLIIRNPTTGLIDHILASQTNRGDSRMRGIDVSANYRTPTWAFGRFDAKLDGTWYQKYEFQAEKNGEWLKDIGIITNDGRYGSAGPNAGLAGLPQLNPRWKHTLSVTWHLGANWHTTLSQRYNTGFTDLTPRTGSTLTKVPALSMWNTNLRYTGFANTTLSAGVNNMFNKWPPITADSAYSGYITSLADVMGRTFRISAEHKF